LNDSISLNNIQIGQDKPDRSLRADAVANRAHLLETAARLFAEDSVAEVHMERIARETGVGKGTLYRHFASKGELCLALLDDQFRAFQNKMLSQMRQGTNDGTSRLEQLAHFLDAYVWFLDTYMPFMCEIERGGVQSLVSPAPYVWLNMTVRGLLQTAVTAGELPTGLDIPFWADMLLAPLSAPFFRFLRERRGFDPNRISKNLRVLIYSQQYAG
jgi:AcrR family transcriptional regulator